MDEFELQQVDNRAIAQKPAPTVAVAFGSGGARGLAHIHVIEVMDELGIRPVAISGSSVGAIMGAAMAAGMTGSEIREFTLEALGSELFGRFWKTRPSSLKELVGGLRVGQFNLERMLRGFLPDQIPETLEELTIPLKVIATDFYGGNEVVCSKGSVKMAVAASAAIPAVFRPVRWDGRILVDGGLVNPVPLDHLPAADIVIAVDVTGSPTGDPDEFPSTVDAAYGASQIMQRAITAQRMRCRQPDILLRPEVDKYRALEFLKAKEILAVSEGIKDVARSALKMALQDRSQASALLV